jgi:hypothetical protein
VGNLVQLSVMLAQEGLALSPAARELFSWGGSGVPGRWKEVAAQLLGDVERLIEDLDLLYVLGAPTEQMAGVNWADAGGSWLSRSGGEGGFLPFRGWRQPDPGASLSTNFIPKLHAKAFEAQTGEFGVWVEGPGDGDCEFGADKLQIGASGKARWGHRSDLVGPPAGDGLLSALRIGHAVEFWRNGAYLSTSETPWSELDVIPLTIGKANSQFSRARASTRLVRAVYLGAPLHSTARKLLYVALARFFMRIDELKGQM